jgi:hypothetical protein
MQSQEVKGDQGGSGGFLLVRYCVIAIKETLGQSLFTRARNITLILVSGYCGLNRFTHLSRLLTCHVVSTHISLPRVESAPNLRSFGDCAFRRLNENFCLIVSDEKFKVSSEVLGSFPNCLFKETTILILFGVWDWQKA